MGMRPAVAERMSTCRDRLDARPWTWLLLGAALVALSQMRFGIGVLAWIAPVPWLRYLRLTSGIRSRVVFGAVVLAAWIVATAKIVTAPLPWILAPLVATPTALLFGAPYFVWSAFRSPTRGWSPPILFAATQVCVEWIEHAALPLGTWGSLANTQLEALPLLQVASLTGAAGVSFLVAWTAACLETALDARSVRPLGAPAAIVLVVFAGGELRLGWSTGRGEPTTSVAAIGTDARFSGLPMPSPDELARIDDDLFERTRTAARRGAALAVWTEAATLVEPADEDVLVSRLRALASEEHIYIAAAWVTPLSTKPLRYRNQYVLLAPSGMVAQRYQKHHPAPGEPSVVGEGALPTTDVVEIGRISGAICYDYDFPQLAREHAANAVDLVFLPSSDWRGIDPIHAQMAVLRAIEGGMSIVRSTRFGLSVAIDPWGRIRAWHSAFDGGDALMMAQVPRRRVATVYATLGDWFPLLCAFAMFLTGERRRGRALNSARA
jgi:apolipoprotein N-acyltransferase